MPKIEPDQFEVYESLILSEQIPDAPKLLDANPNFATWYLHRMRVRRQEEMSS